MAPFWTHCYHWQPEQIRESGSDAAYLFHYITPLTEILQRIITNKNIQGLQLLLSHLLTVYFYVLSLVSVCIHFVLFLFFYCEGSGAHMANWMTQSSAQQTQCYHGYHQSDQTAPHPHTAEEAD